MVYTHLFCGQKKLKIGVCARNLDQDQQRVKERNITKISKTYRTYPIAFLWFPPRDGLRAWQSIINTTVSAKRIAGWWYTYPSEKYESQWEGLSDILWKIKKSCLKPPIRFRLQNQLGTCWDLSQHKNQCFVPSSITPVVVWTVTWVESPG